MPEIKCLRSPICSVLGHVDHGKSSILDSIRESNILATEAGGITQAIGASIIPLSTIQKKCGKLLESLNMKFTIPGLLFIDTPGHAAFTSLRKRGGSLADIAIVVIDINEGFKPQTIEAIEILKASKIPFVIAANKLDLIPGFVIQNTNLLDIIGRQHDSVKSTIDTRLYELVGQIFDRFHMEAERFDRVDFTRQVAIIPCSAKHGIGISELLMVVTGLAQRFLEDNLKLEAAGPAKGTILEVKEEKGLGLTLDVILYDGQLNVGDTIVIATLNEPIVTKVRCLLQPDELSEMRDRKSKFRSVKCVTAATGVKISAPGLDGAISGMPLQEASQSNVEEIKAKVMKEVRSSIIETEKDGIMIKADTIGSLEALTSMLKERDVPIRKATIGPFSKKDLSEAESVAQSNPKLGVVLGFNIPHVSSEHVKVITGNIIYKIIEEYEEWVAGAAKSEEAKKLEKYTSPCKIQYLPHCTFHKSNPAVVGAEILMGKLRPGTPLTLDCNSRVCQVKSIQDKGKTLESADRGMKVAVALPGITAGRQIKEEDTLYSFVTEDEFREMKKLKEFLSPDAKEVLREIAEIHRRQNPVWGI
ncbi:translation initiation factor IF-2 [Candidatus Woesearchaeota archaeon]|nr:translation initiation factor IF-2 [Candidatus Woesearchaeota archaeon]